MNQHLERLDSLAPFLRMPVLALMEACKVKLKRTLLVVHAWRSPDEQYLLYQQGRTWNPSAGTWDVSDPGKIVTKARPGSSAHNVVTLEGTPAAMGVDVIPFTAEGVADWHVAMRFWDALYEEAWKVGLDPLGDQVGAYFPGDLGHFEEPGWKLKLGGMGLRLPTPQESTAI